MTTRVDISVDASGLLTKVLQQTLANREALAIREAQVKAEEKGIKQRKERRIREGLDPETGVMSTPSTLAGSGIRRINEEPAANRRPGDEVVGAWIINSTVGPSSERKRTLSLGSSDLAQWRSFELPSKDLRPENYQGETPPTYSAEQIESIALAARPEWVTPEGLLPVNLLEPLRVRGGQGTQFICAPNGLNAIRGAGLRYSQMDDKFNAPFYWASFRQESSLPIVGIEEYGFLPEDKKHAGFFFASERLGGYSYNNGLFTADRGGRCGAISATMHSPWAHAVDTYGPVWDHLACVVNRAKTIKRIVFYLTPEVGETFLSENGVTAQASFSIMKGTREQYSFYRNSVISGENLSRDGNGNLVSAWPNSAEDRQNGWPFRHRFTELAPGEVIFSATAGNSNSIFATGQAISPSRVNVDIPLSPGDYIWVRVHSMSDTASYGPYFPTTQAKQTFIITLIINESIQEVPGGPIVTIDNSVQVGELLDGWNEGWSTISQGAGSLAWPSMHKAYKLSAKDIKEIPTPPSVKDTIVPALYGTPTVTEAPGGTVESTQTVQNESYQVSPVLFSNFVTFNQDSLARGQGLAFTSLLGWILQDGRLAGHEPSTWLKVPFLTPGRYALLPLTTSSSVPNAVRRVGEYPVSLGFYLGVLPSDRKLSDSELAFGSRPYEDPPIKIRAPGFVNSYMHYTPVIYNAIEGDYKGTGSSVLSRAAYNTPANDLGPDARTGFYGAFSKIEDLFPENSFNTFRLPAVGADTFSLSSTELFKNKELFDSLIRADNGLIRFVKYGGFRASTQIRGNWRLLATEGGDPYPTEASPGTQGYDATIWPVYCWYWGRQGNTISRLTALGFPLGLDEASP